MRDITKIVIHCAATPNGKQFTVDDIDSWHVERGFRRGKYQMVHRPELKAIGYHHVIYLDGAVASGRHHDEIGAHAAGHNSESIGICLIGTDKFTARQWESLAILIQSLWSMYPGAAVMGHRDLPNVAKSCPGFNAKQWVKNMGKPADGHLWEA